MASPRGQGRAVMSKVTGMVSPTQIGFGIRRAVEAAAHAARIYVASLQYSSNWTLQMHLTLSVVTLY